MTKSKQKPFDFQSALAEIEDINAWFEQSDFDPNKAVAKYSRGLQLIKQCQTEFQKIENQVTQIQADFDKE